MKLVKESVDDADTRDCKAPCLQERIALLRLEDALLFERCRLLSRQLIEITEALRSWQPMEAPRG